MYQALYRKWRPKTFDDVVGQEHITVTLKQQLAAGRLSHAYLFVGTRGTGKTTCAKILSRAVNCENPINGNPCNKCAACLGIESGSILDVEELDAASNNGVDNIRALRDEAIYTPAAVKKRVYIVDEVHMLSLQAFNALLKILEEPPEHLIFILATTELNKVPATILSRCQRYTFKRLTTDVISSRLKYVAEQEGMKLTDGAAQLLARLADGGMRDGLSLLDQCSGSEVIDEERVTSAVGLTGAEDTKKLLNAVLNQDAAEAMALLDNFYFNGKELGGSLESLMKLCRDIVMLRVAKEKGEALLSGGYDRAELINFAKRAPASSFMLYIKVIQDSLAELPRSFDKRITAEMCLLKLCSEQSVGGEDALRARLDRIEEKIKNGITVKTVSADAETAPNAVPKAAEKAPLPDDGDMPPMPTDDDTPSFAETEPEIKPFRQTAPAPAKPAALTDSTEIWGEILKTAEGKLDKSKFSFLGELHAVGKIEGDSLTVMMKNPIAMNMINTPEVSGVLKAAAEAVCGRPIVVRFSEYVNEPKPNMSKLDALRQFSNIKFQ